MASRSVVSRPEPLHRQVARHIENDIAAGKLRDGDRLPSTRELARQWEVSSYTINEAMDLLSERGLVVSRPRAGRIVQAPDHAPNHERERPKNPRVILIGGYAGSGKTELGRVIARETGWPILDKDTLTRPVVETALEILGTSPNDRESETYLKNVRPHEYEAVMDAMTENVTCGNSAIVTAPFIGQFSNSDWINRTQASCEQLGAEITYVWVYCDSDTMRTYLRRRGAGRDAAKLTDWQGYLSSIDVDFRPPVPHVLVDNCVSGESLTSQAKRIISASLEARL